MESLILEKVNGGLLFLYSSGSKKEFCCSLESVIHELFGNVRFSVLSAGEDESSFWLEHAAGAETPIYDRVCITSEALARAMRGGAAASDDLAIDMDGAIPPVRAVRVLEFGEKKLGVVAFHDPLAPLEALGSGDVEQYVFEHVCTAYYHVASRDLLAEQLEWSKSKLDGISEISGLLGQFEIGPLLNRLMYVYVRLTEAQVGSIVLEGGIAEDVEWGLSLAILDQLRFADGRSVRAAAMETREPLLVKDYSRDPRFARTEACSIESVLCVPLVSKACVLGTVNLVNSSPAKQGMFTERDRDTVVTISSLAASAVENAVLHNDLIEKERIKANLQIARAIQQRMYPKNDVAIPGYQAASVSRSCEETGGDYFDFLDLGAGRVALVVGDVSGHGIGSALLMASGRANLRALMSVKSDLKEVIDRLNDLVALDMDAERFMTLFVITIDPVSHRLEYVNAGHDFPLIWRAASGVCEELPSTGMPVGMISGVSYDVGQAEPLAPGDVFLMTTDGVWEAVNPAGDRYGKGRLARLLAEVSARPPEGILTAILADVEGYVRGRSFADDQTLVVIKRSR